MVSGLLIDVFAHADGVMLWVKTRTGEDVFVQKPFVTWFGILACTKAQQALDALGWEYHCEKRQLFDGRVQAVCIIPVTARMYHQRIKELSSATQFRIPLFNADIPIEQRFLCAHNLCVGWMIDSDTLRCTQEELCGLSELSVRILADKDPRDGDACVTKIYAGEKVFSGSEQEVLSAFANFFSERDIDVLFVFEAYCYLPLLDARLRVHGISCAFHRISPAPLSYRGGRSFHSYGQVRFRDFSFALRGRLLIDSSRSLGEDSEGLFALASISCLSVQRLSARSAGACFQGSLVSILLKEDVLVSFKHKPVPDPITMTELCAQDRAGISLDPVIGVHTEVAELDFASLFPALMSEKNLSAETIGSSGVKAPDIDVCVLQDREGFVARAIRPFLALREEYRSHGTLTAKRRSQAVKGVLVSANGYLRFREFKLGLSTTHAVLCSWARYALLTAKRMAEERGFSVVAGLVDSIYIHKKGLSRQDVSQLAQDISSVVGVRIKIEGIFSWIAFCPSTVHPTRPARTHYFGAFTDGSVKIRGLHSRQSGVPLVVRRFQEQAIKYLAQLSSDALYDGVGEVCVRARGLLSRLDEVPVADAAFSVRLTKDSYAHNSVQKQLADQLREQGVVIRPGRVVRFVYCNQRPVLLASARALCPVQYRAALVRAVCAIAHPLGMSSEEVELCVAGERQTTLFSLPTGHLRQKLL